MQVNVRAALRFKHRAGLEHGIVAFDANAYPEFFKSELWTVVGPYAFCDRSFEIEPDCDYTEAFLAMASEAVEGSVGLREDDRRDWTEVMKLGRPINRWVKFPREDSDSFGRKARSLALAWEAAIEKAKADDAVKAAKSAKKAAKDASRCTIVALPGNPSHVVVRPDGSLAVGVGNELVFVAASGEQLGTSELGVREYSQFQLGITGLHALPDGRVLAFSELDHEARLATLGQPTLAIAGSQPERPITSASCGDGFTVLAGRHSFVVLDDAGTITHEHAPWGDADYVRGVSAWRAGVLVSSCSKTAYFDRDGTKRYEVDGGEAVPHGDGFVTFGDREAYLVRDGKPTRVELAGSVGWVQRDGVYVRATAIVDGMVFVGTTTVGAITAYDLATGVQRWQITKPHPLGVSGLVATPRWVATFAGPAIAGALKPLEDTSIAAWKDGAELARCDPKAIVLGAIALGDDALAAWVDGRTAGTKVYVWRDISTAPKLTTLSGHKGRVHGLANLPDGRFVSWAADKTVRIWS
jgi:outer membrane protein assembly factor BamB